MAATKKTRVAGAALVAVLVALVGWRLLFSADAADAGVIVDVGTGGVENSRHSSGVPNVPADAGADALTIEDYQHSESDAINPGYCSVPLPIKIA